MEIIPYIAIISGILCILVCFYKLEGYCILIPFTVLEGFSFGVATTIGMSQINNAFGLKPLDKCDGIKECVLQYF